MPHQNLLSTRYPVRWLCTVLLLSVLGVHCVAHAAATTSPIAIAIHGGAGTITREDLTTTQEATYRATLREALEAGHKLLSNGASSVAAVEAAVQVLEASPLFNAGVGAVMTWEGHHELDASIMSGVDLQAGAVAGVKTVESPIALARAVMQQSRHVLLSGTGAEDFAREAGLPPVPNSEFTTPRRKAALEKAKARLREQADVTQVVAPLKWGTVGAVALDQQGNLAAATSTGGMTAKRWGRIGDSPLIGAGTYADNRSCAVSATGHGEFFIRYNVAADICARVRYQGKTIEQAGREVIFNELLPAGGTGGVIILDPAGNISMPFNTPGMYRGSIDHSGRVTIEIYEVP